MSSPFPHPRRRLTVLCELLAGVGLLAFATGALFAPIHPRGDQTARRLPPPAPSAAAAPTVFSTADSPELSLEIGYAHIDACVNAGRFADALAFAREGSADARETWLVAAYVGWARVQPEAALRHALAVGDEALRISLLRLVASLWSTNGGASAMIACADTLADPAARHVLLDEALPRWAAQDPVGLSRWLEARPPAAELDEGAAALATFPALVERHPEVAASWAESIVDAELRRNALGVVLAAWTARDPAAARACLAQNFSGDGEQRAHLQSLLAPPQG